MQNFIITVDTEGDNLWGKKATDTVSTENAKFIPMFQELCERYGFKPVYLTNYEMAQNDSFVEYIAPKNATGLCEIGMHLHAWNMLDRTNLIARTDCEPGLPYLIEYPTDVMEEKIAAMTELLTRRFGEKPTTHRAGRWAMDDRYYKLLHKYGYTVDCSVTPHENWQSSPGYTVNSSGTDYSGASEKPYIVCQDKNTDALFEIPMTIREKIRYFPETKINIGDLKHAARCALIGNKTWMRILTDDISAQKKLIDSDNSDYLMFMLHSSELMPGNLYFPTENDVRNFYNNMETLFKKASEKREGITLRDYRNQLIGRGI